MARLVAIAAGPTRAVLAGLDAVRSEGDAALPLPGDLPDAGREHLLARLRPDALYEGGHVTPLHTDAPAGRLPSGSTLVALTSGSTGARTGVVHTADGLAAAVAASRLRLGARDGRPWHLTLPLHHLAGVLVVERSRAAGREPIVHDDPARTLGGAEPGWISLVPTQLGRMLAAGVDLARHDGVLLGGAAAPAGLLEAAAEAGVHVVTSYGSTETCGGCVYDGRPLDTVEVDLDEDGRIRLRGPMLAAGLLTDGGPARSATDAGGWFATSDRGRLEAGRLVVEGRLDRTVVSGGENVPAAAVEVALADLPWVAEVAVVGLPHPDWGAAVTAVVVPTTGARPPGLAELRAALSAALPDTWRPTGLLIGAALPRDGLGKVTGPAVAAAVERGEVTQP